MPELPSFEASMDKSKSPEVTFQDDLEEEDFS